MAAKVNLNDVVHVELNDFGRKILSRFYVNVPATKWAGYFQLHELMNIFGIQLEIGRQLPFATEISLEQNLDFSPESPAFDADLRRKREVLAEKIALKIAKDGIEIGIPSARMIGQWTKLVMQELESGTAG